MSEVVVRLVGQTQCVSYSTAARLLRVSNVFLGSLVEKQVLPAVQLRPSLMSGDSPKMLIAVEDLAKFMREKKYSDQDIATVESLLNACQELEDEDEGEE